MFQKYEATPVSPEGEIVNEAEYKFPEANHQKTLTHEITNKAKSRYIGFKLPLVNIKRIVKEDIYYKRYIRKRNYKKIL